MTPVEAVGVLYGISVIGYTAGVAASGWRLRRFRQPWSWGLDTAAMAALVLGWPTGWRVHAQLRRGERDLATLVNPRTRPLLVALAAVLVPFAVLLPVPDNGWKDWVAIPLGLAGVVLACSTWLRDRPQALADPA